MEYVINRDAIEYAKQLIEEGARARNTMWANSIPSPQKAERFRREHGDQAFARWYLVVDPNGTGIAGYQFPVGDFARVHESGVRAARRHGELNGHPELVAAADEILDLLDRLNAC